MTKTVKVKIGLVVDEDGKYEASFADEDGGVEWSRLERRLNADGLMRRYLVTVDVEVPQEINAKAEVVE